MYKPNGKVQKIRKSYNESGCAHELTFTCYQYLPLLSKDRTRQWLIESLDKARKRWNFELWAYVIMPDHVHILLFPLDDDYQIASILRAIKQPVAQKAVGFLKENAPEWLKRLKISRSNGKTEYRFWQQGGGYDRNILKLETAWASVEYIHNNPIRRDLVDHPEDWSWSSAGWYAGREDVKLSMDNHPPYPPVR